MSSRSFSWYAAEQVNGADAVPGCPVRSGSAGRFGEIFPGTGGHGSGLHGKGCGNCARSLFQIRIMPVSYGYHAGIMWASCRFMPGSSQEYRLPRMRTRTSLCRSRGTDRVRPSRRGVPRKSPFQGSTANRRAFRKAARYGIRIQAFLW